ncbi:HNH endonuclease [Acidimicrobium ferrooxidans DSM 10331]|uniref:HNH endonuclease n=1 Tax=Acidimicrobium ferrooxidans (strain DSM 10331 / JCM 15462 / NBRC 103882 / ICP) TaxID=525909 RepID=C7LY28_ACIFD|nr:HNH endonuclease [Acidimicrobium ferrooxidans]ACU53636.1 HNH endonuclease [Acidimicrobium ferrooxidans DSM 10331]
MTAGVLVLNASYEALGVVSVERAVGMVVDGDVDVVDVTDLVLHSPSTAIRVPSILRLQRYVRIPATRRIAPTRRAIFARDGYRCQYCGGPAENVDHVIPRSRGGRHVWENVVAACRACNAAKSDRLPAEAGMHPRREPRAPAARTGWLLTVGVRRPEWEPYLRAAWGDSARDLLLGGGDDGRELARREERTHAHSRAAR